MSNILIGENMKYGYYRIAAAIPKVKIADCNYNLDEIKKLIIRAEQENVSIITFPELSLTAYTCADLFSQSLLIDKTLISISELLKFTKDKQIIAIIGAPLRIDEYLFNTAIVIQKGEIKGIVPKIFLPNYSEFYESRWFTSGKDIKKTHIDILSMQVPFGNDLLFRSDDLCFGIEICEIGRAHV